MKKYLVIIFIVFVAFSVKAQVYKYKVFNQDNLLNNDFINAIIQDDYGNLWVATGDGLSQYNGKKVINYSTQDGLADNAITSEYKDNYNILWFGHQNGKISIYNDNKFHELNTDLNTKITSITEDAFDDVWIASQSSGIIRVKDYNIKNFELKEDINVTSVYYLKDSMLLVGTMSGLYMYNINESLDLVKFRKVVGVDNYNVSSISGSIDSNKVWISTTDDGIFSLTFENEIQVKKINVGNEEPESVQNVFEDFDGSLIVSTLGTGLLKFIPTREDNNYIHSITYDQSNGLSSNYVKVAFRDFEHNLWVGTFGEGLLQQLQDAFLFFPIDVDSISKSITALFNDNNKVLWLGDARGLIKLNIISGKVLDSNFNLDDKITVIRKKNNNELWIGTENKGLFTYSIDERQFKHVALEDNMLSNNINSLLVVGDTLWVGTNNGIYKYFNNRFKRFTTRSGLGHNVVNDLLYDNKQHLIYVACLSNSLAYIMNDSVLHYPITDKNDLFDLVSLTKDNDDSLWIATKSSGIIWFKRAGSIIFNSENGMKTDYCHAIIADNNNNFIVGHQNGISKMLRDKRKFNTYGKTEGLFCSVNNNAITKDSLGNIWIGTTEGLVKYIPKNDFEVLPPDPKLVSIYVNGQLYNQKKLIKLKFGHYKIEFNFQGVSLRSPEKIKFRYLLAESENNYTETKDGKIIYNNLTTGDYRLVVYCGINDEWNQVPVKIKITIAKPIWFQWWFIVSVVVVIILLIFIIIMLRLKRMQKINLMIERRLQIRTKEITEKNKELEVKNQDIMDSLNYAQSLQASIFPNIEFINSFFPESFIFFKPKDIVSGDFYRFDKYSDKNKFLITCADCTGHGVPAALMSMIGNILIKDIIANQENRTPGDILHELDSAVSKTLRQNKGEIREEGMDVVLCEIDLDEMHVRFASAMRPIVLIQNNELVWTQGSRFSIGGQKGINKDFENLTYKLNKGDIIYMFSDGFVDQFGGKHGKKFKTNSFKSLLLKIHDKPMHEQKEIIEETFSNWITKNDDATYPQIDDILVMGFKI